MNPVVVRGRRMLATFGSLALGAGLVLTLAPSAGASFPAADTGDRPAPRSAPSGPAARALAEALPARLGAATFTSVYGATKVTSSTGRKLMAAVSASKQQGNEPSFSVSLTRGQSEMHSWNFPAPNSSFDISAKAAGKLTLSSKKTGGMGKLALKVKPDGAMKSERCGGKVYAKRRNVVISGTFFFDTDSKWGKVGSKTKPFRFRTVHQVYFSYDVNCPPVDFPDPCENTLSWAVWRDAANTTTSVSGTKQGTDSALFAYRSTMLAKPKGASRSDMVWGTGNAPVLTVAPDESASMKIYGVRGSGTMADPSPGATYDDPCDTGTQHTTFWWSGTVTNDATPIKIPAQVFGSFTVPDGSEGYMSKSWSD